jgi:hypothetical protein
VETGLTEAPDVVAPVVDRRSGPSAHGVRGRSDTWLRVLCHLAAELPLVVFGVVELARGWRPLFDNADLALRSYQVFSAHSPLVGHQMAVSVGSRAVFGPGPLQSWLLALPVRIDPAQGALWGSVLAVVVAVALAVEATWSVGGWRGGATTAAGFLVIALVRPEMVLDPVWNVWFAVLFLVAAFATALAVGVGRFRWWPVTVVLASVAVQAQAAYAPPAIALCVVAPVLGLVLLHREAVPRIGWLIGGIGAGIVVWAAPLAQQVADDPGNLTLLARASAAGPTIGAAGALRAVGGATGLPPDWVHPLPTGGGLAQFYGVARLVQGPEWWGLAVLLSVVAIGAVALATGRRALGASAVLTSALSVGVVVTVATIPTSQFLVLGYLGAVLAPVGLAVGVTVVWAVGEVVLVAVGRERDRPDGTVATTGRDRACWPAAVVLVGLSVWLTVSGLGRMDGAEPTLSGWPAVRTTDEATAAAAVVAPHGPFRLEVEGPSGAFTFAVESGVAYQLVTRGLDPRPTIAVAYPTFGRPPVGGPTVVVTIPGPGGRVRARLRTGS